MHLEQMFDRPIFGYRSIFGYFHWLKDIKGIIMHSNASLSDKWWCIRHGFTVSSLNLHGKNNLKQNYKDYLSEKQYLMLHPLNGAFSVWIDDKLTMKNIFSRYDMYLPEYYFHIEKDAVFKLSNCPISINKNGHDGIIQLLKERKKLVAKQLWGSCGNGFYRLEFIDNEFYITGNKVTEKELLNLLCSLEHYVITEFIRNHDVLFSIWPEATNTVRIMMATVNNAPVLMRSFIRFGNAKSNGVDNAHAGGIEAIIDEETGKILFAISMDENNYATKIDVHPDSGSSFDINIPYWDEMIRVCKQICMDYPELRYWGFDVAITQEKFKILEINSLPGLMAAQLKMPLLKDKKTRDVYKSFGLKL